MSIKQTSLVWEFFTVNGDLVTCTKCPKTYKLATAKSSTQPLRYHLKTQHSVEFNNAEKLFPNNTETSALTIKAEPVEVVKSVSSMAKQLSDFLKQQSSEKST